MHLRPVDDDFARAAAGALDVYAALAPDDARRVFPPGLPLPAFRALLDLAHYHGLDRIDRIKDTTPNVMATMAERRSDALVCCILYRSSASSPRSGVQSAGRFGIGRFDFISATSPLCR